MSKETVKRDKNGRFAKKADKPKVDVKFEVERPEGMSAEEYVKQLEKECEAYKITAERMSGKYLDKCAEYKEAVRELASYKNHWDRLMEAARWWKKRALEEEFMHYAGVETLRSVYIYIGWLKSKLSWFKMWKYRKELLDADIRHERALARLENPDGE